MALEEEKRIKAAFDPSAQTYDRARRQLIPCFDDFYRAVIDRLPFPEEAEVRLLDLGAGTGLLSDFLSRRFPRAKITLLDLSEAMLEKARRRFEGRAGHFEFRIADYAEGPLPGRFDAVVSALSIHHLEDEAKRALFGKVHDALAGGGLFINADQVLGATPEIEKDYREGWLRQVRARGVSGEDLAAAIERMKADRMAMLSSQLKWLEEAKFREVRCWYQSDSFAVFGGRK